MPKLIKIFTVILTALIALALSLSVLSAMTASASTIDGSMLSGFEPAPLAPLFAQGKSGAGGYTYLDEVEPFGPTYAFTDVSASGSDPGVQLVFSGPISDESSVDITLPFNFEFYGVSDNTLKVGFNGIIVFDPLGSERLFDNQCLDIAPFGNIIAPWWDDWATGQVYTKVLGTTPNRSVVIQWDKMVHYTGPYSGTLEPVTFQAIFFETSNAILFQYADTEAGPSVLDQGGRGTVGVRGLFGNSDLQYSCNQNSLIDERAIRFSRNAITIVKDARPNNDPQSFQFSGTDDISSTFILDDNTSPTYPVSQTFFLVPGVYTIAETLPTDWDLTQLSCTGNATPEVTDTVTTTVTLGVGEDVICTFENTKRGSITIAKDATPNSSQVFTFTGDLTTSFTLTDDGSLGPNSITFPSLVSGTYTVTEEAVGGWTLAAISCNDGDGGTSTDEANRLVAIDLDPGQDITCTFENSQLSTLYVRKVTDPDPDPFTTPFTFTASPSLTSTSFLLRNGQVFTFSNVTSGTYAITETVAADWTTDSSCSNGSNTGSIAVDPGETVTCTFTNTAATGSITVTKVTDPPGLSGTFNFTTTGLVSPSFTLLSDGDSQVFSGVKIGTYAISETVSANYNLTTSCSDGSSVDGIVVNPNDKITCVFTNTAKFGTITAKKVSLPASSDAFTFTSSLTSTDFTLTNGQTRTFTVTAGSVYSIAETVPAGWVLTGSACDNGDDVDNITALGGKKITCTFTNTLDIGTVTIEKQTTPDGSPQVFTFTTSLTDTGSFTLTDNLSQTFSVPSGSYTVSEEALAGWNLVTPISCSDGSPISNIDVQLGEAITCTFVNRQLGKILVRKVKNPSGELPVSFNFTVSDGSSPIHTFLLGHGATSNPILVQPGNNYRIEEGNFAGWSTEIGCTNGQTVSNGNRFVDVSTQPGQTVTCTFTNTKQTRLSIRKVTIPSPDPVDSTFDFTTSPGLSPASFTLSESSSQQNFDVASGTFTITEAATTGWNLTDISCTKPGFVKNLSAGSVAVSIVPGDNNVTCVYTNTLQPQTVTVIKATNPATSTQSFNFTTNMSPTNFVLSNGLSQNFTVYPGSGYTVTEQTLPDWQVTATCNDNDSTLNNISVAIGEDVTCTITNTQVITPEFTVYLPALIKESTCMIDLRINDLSVAGGVVSVEVENNGSCATDSGFWVDLYANPLTLPSSLVGVTADRRWRSPAVNALHGMAWKVSTLGAGQTIILKSDGSTGLSPTDVVWPPAAGATIYAYVDSFDNNDPNNATNVEIPETNESNNQSAAVTLSATDAGTKHVSDSAMAEPRRDVN